MFVTNRESAGVSPATLRKYRTFTTRITAYAESRGYIMLDQFTPADIDLFWADWKLNAGAKGKRLHTLRTFFRFCVNRKWIPESPVSTDIKAPVGSSKAANKAPFSDDELQRITKAWDDVKVEWKNETGLGVWTGADLKDIIWLMVYTGCRISDATFFNISRLQGNQVFIRATKNGGDVFAYSPDWLRDRLRARAERFGNRPFIVGRSERLETVPNVWRSRIAKAFAATPATQTTRLVGYYNHKYTEAAHLVTIDYGRIDRLYTPTECPQVRVAARNIACDVIRPLPPTRAPGGPYETRRLDPAERARRYLSRVPPAIAGEHGDVHTFRACCGLVRGFALDDDLALGTAGGVELAMPTTVERARPTRQGSEGEAIRA